MQPSMDISEGLLNDGLIIINPQPFATETRTIIVTGVARSGTSMVAQLLDMAGVLMGTDLDDVVFEDHEVADAFGSSDPNMLDRLVSSRNQQSAVWGFKRPHLFHHCSPDLEKTFRSPRFIVTYRDPVAVARRNRISEHVEVLTGLRAAAEDIQRCTAFTLGLSCPVLLISYEKALQRPVALVEELIAFCGLAASRERRDRMVAAVRANRDEYVRLARRMFQGYVDGVHDGFLLGWCWQIGVPTPLTLEVGIGDQPAIPILAESFRADLAVAEVGDGYHAFRLDLSGQALDASEIVTVRVQGRLFELAGSGRTVAQLSG